MTSQLSQALMLSRSLLRSGPLAVALLAAPIVTHSLGAQTIQVYAGATERVTMAPGTKFTVPIGVDLSAIGSQTLASVQVRLNWDPSALLLDSIRPMTGSTLEYNFNDANRLTGEVSFNAYSTLAFTGSAVLAQAFYTSFSQYGGPRIYVTPTAAGSELGVNLLSSVRARSLDVCLAPTKRWGDVTDDDAVNIIDAQQLARSSISLSVLNAAAIAARGDVNEDATVNILDAQQVARHSVGLAATGTTRVAVEFQVIPTTTASLVSSVGDTYTIPTGVVSFRVDAIARDATGRDISGCIPIVWSSNNPTVVTVSGQGGATVRSSGAAQLTAIGGGRSTFVRVLPTLTSGDPWIVANEAMRSWYLAATHFEPYHAMQVTADAVTSNFGNFGMRFNNVEPRTAYDNVGADAIVALRPWQGNYAALNSAVMALEFLDRNFGSTGGADETRATALFAQASALTNLALLFDRSLPIVRNASAVPSLMSYQQMTAFAVAKWDSLITFTNGKSFVLPTTTLPTSQPLTATLMRRFANTMAARTLMLSARTAAENDATNWSQVLAYANQGITGDGVSDVTFDVNTDGTNWYSYITLYGNLSTWIRTDSRLINRMAPNVPATYAGTLVVPVPTDLRLGTTAGATADYVYLGGVIGDPARGIYMQSPFYHKRYVHVSFAVATPAGLAPYILAAENDLMIAEALARTGGDLARAATLVNKTRVTRGGLAPMTAGSGSAAILAAIEYERDVELQNTNGLALFDRRRLDLIQAGTWRHLPIPSSVASYLGLATYTFGGVGLPDK